MNLEFSLEAFKSSLEIDFFLNDIGQGELNVSWKVIVSANSSRWSIKGSISQEVVLAWKHHLEELLEVKSTVSVAVKELAENVSL